MPTLLRYLLACLITVALVGGPLAYAWYRQAHVRNFRVVRDGVLYRSGQLSLFGLRRVVHDYGIRTVVTLRDGHRPGDPPPDLAEEEYCGRRGIRYVRISPRDLAYWAPDGSVPAEAGVRRFLAVMDDPHTYPVLVHCFAGRHRTGALCAVYRIEYERWTNEKALAEMRDCGYSNLDDEWDILGFLARFRPRWQAPIGGRSRGPGPARALTGGQLPPESTRTPGG